MRLNKNKNIKLFLNYFLGPALFIWLSWSIFNQVRRQPDLAQSWQSIKNSLDSSNILYLIAVVFLMIINWAIEAVKWKISVRNIQPVSFLRSFKAVLSGVSFSVTTPNRIGEYFGRILYMDEGNRLRTISLTIVSSMSQLIITLLAGVIGLFFIQKQIIQEPLIADIDLSMWLKVFQCGVIIVLLVLTLLYFRLHLLANLADRLFKNSRYSYLFQALKDIDATLVFRLLSLSATRYIVFIIQYFLLFRLFDVEVNWWQAFGAVSVIFLVLAIIPSFAIIELGLRGQISLQLLHLFSRNDLGIGFSTLGIWIINLVIPAVAGSLLILSIKIFKNRNEVHQSGSHS
jgi:uncharacterized membrane protein YbhN (UPF0104 family)